MTATPVGISHLRVTLSEKLYIGPGRADLLELIAETGSITEAAKRMGMSYKRAWQLVQALNADPEHPLVETSRGGPGQGASLTLFGGEVLSRYRFMQMAASSAIAPDLQALISVMSERK